jgi:Ca2+:H+ antiporter
MKILKYLLIFVPVSIIVEFMDLHVEPTIMFILSALAIVPLAGLMGEATEEISFYSGPRAGGFTMRPLAMRRNLLSLFSH